MMSTTEVEIDFDPPNEREEGELDDSDVEEGAYIPLTRPETFNPPSLVHMQIQDEQSDEPSPESSATDSDEEPRRRAKRIKVRPRRPQPQQHDKKEKYNVWYKTLQEELLSEDMISFDVSKKRNYGVESYDYRIKYRVEDEASKNAFTNTNSNSQRDLTSNKRRHTDRSNIKLRLGKRVNSHSYANEKCAPKFLDELTVNVEDSLDMVASDIALKLSEEKKDLIQRIVEVIGTNKAIEIYKETQRIEADGGMLIMNGARRRTPGGLYFFLLKRDDDISQDMISKIFSEDKKETTRRIKKTHRSRQKAMEQLKQTLTDSELPSLASRGEATAQSEHGSNPPPSPATDARECSSDTDAHSHTEADTHAQTQPHTHADMQPHTHADMQPHTDMPAVATQQPVDVRTIQDYDDDDFLDIMCNDEMDIF